MEDEWYTDTEKKFNKIITNREIEREVGRQKRKLKVLKDAKIIFKSEK